jgi:predicted transposase/invertase (TIGR01784 family)
MFQLHDLRKTRVWQDAEKEGVEKGVEQGLEKGIEQSQRQLVHKWLAKGMATKEIAALLDISVQEVRRLAKSAAR